MRNTTTIEGILFEDLYELLSIVDWVFEVIVVNVDSCREVVFDDKVTFASSDPLVIREKWDKQIIINNKTKLYFIEAIDDDSDEISFAKHFVQVELNLNTKQKTENKYDAFY